MVHKIQSLPDTMIRQITAGEVIDSLAAVGRELIENALDAGANRLVVEVDPQRWWLRVTDNGHGISPQNLAAAAQAHTTSKVRTLADLRHLNSLGFRGEALHSLALLGQLDIKSALHQSPDGSVEGSMDGSVDGWWASYNAEGEILDLQPVAIATGTTVVTVANLFGDWPSRRASLGTPTQQLKLLQTWIQTAALTHPGVTWQVKRGDQVWFNLYPGQTAQDIFPQFLRGLNRHDLCYLRQPLPMPDTPGTERGQALLNAAAEASDLRSSYLELVVGLPDRYHRRRMDWVCVAVNHRVVRLPELEQALVRGFAQTLPRDRFPLAYLHLVIPSQFVDWNRHPAKQEIYLQDLAHWQHCLTQALRTLGQEFSPHSRERSVGSQLQQLLRAAEPPGQYRIISNPLSDPLPHPDAPDLNRLPEPDALENLQLRAIAQLRKTYIVAEHEAGIWLIEQHIAHERVLYEQLCDRWPIIPLDQPLVLEQLSPQQQQQLRHLGIEVEPFGEQTWMIRSAPALLAERGDHAAALWELSLGRDLQAAQVATACRSAIRNGTELSLTDMQTLLNQWQRTRQPRTCPHGRPICLVLAESDLSRYFRRHWVIGKSHGV